MTSFTIRCLAPGLLALSAFSQGAGELDPRARLAARSEVSPQVQASSAVGLPPPDLAPGERYRVIFTTVSERDAQSTNISDYNAFVAADVAAHGVAELQAAGASYAAVASTAAEDARDNTGTNPGVEVGVPVYRVDGVRVADDNAQLWSDALLAPPSVRSDGSSVSELPWTGTACDGTAQGNPLGTATPGYGANTLVDCSWTDINVYTSDFPDTFYGLSSVLTVPGGALPPADLQPGDPYRVVFLTVAQRDALSANIDDYNAFVEADLAASGTPALRGLDASCSALASTSAVHARDNTQTDPAVDAGVPIYRVDGVRVADDYAQLWSGLHLADMAVDSAGNPVSGYPSAPWTGTACDGAAHPSPLGSTTPMYGLADQIDCAWTEFVTWSAPGDLGTLFGITSVVNVPSVGTNYCTAGTSASGCQARISAGGTPSASAGSGFYLRASGVEGDKDGIFFYGANGRQANAWGSGTSFQCVVPPVRRAGLLPGTGGAGSCNGEAQQDLNVLWTAKPNQNPGAGALVQAQFWYRDPQNTGSQTTSLSDALEFALMP